MSSFNESMERVEQAAHHTGRSEMVNDCSRLIVKSLQIVEQMIDERREEIKDEIWEDMQSDFEYTKELYKLHKKIKRESK